MSKKEKLVPSGAPIRRGSALLERLRANHDNVDTSASAMERVTYVDVWNPTKDLPSISQEFLVGARGWLAGRICQERATFSKGKSSFMYLQYAAAQKRHGAYCMHVETEGAASPADWVASFGCDPEELIMSETKSLDECLALIDEVVCEIRGGFGGSVGDSGRASKTKYTDPLDAAMEHPIMIGVDSLSQLTQEEKVVQDVVDMSRTAQPGVMARKMREWFRLRVQRLHQCKACLFLTTHETQKIATGPAAFAGPQKTSVAQEAVGISSTYAYDVSVSKWTDNRTGDIRGNATNLKCFKNKWSGDKFGGAVREVQLFLDIGHGFDLIHSDAEFLMKHPASPFAEKFGLFDKSQVPVRTSAGIKCPLLSDKTFRSEDDFIRAFYANEDLLMCCRQALKLRGFGFDFETSWKNQPAEQPTDQPVEQEE
jgi:RecA/RadA recombinase